EHLRHAGPGEDGGKGGARAMQGGQALDLAGAGAKGLGRRRPEQRGCQAVPAPGRLDEKADTAPGRRRLMCTMEDTGGGQSGEIAARAEAAPAHRLALGFGNQGANAAGRQQLEKGALVRLALHLTPELASARQTPMHAPATGAGAAFPEESLDGGAIGGGDHSNFHTRRHDRSGCALHHGRRERARAGACAASNNCATANPDNTSMAARSRERITALPSFCSPNNPAWRSSWT